MLDLDFVLQQKVKPPPLLTYWLRHFLQKREGRMICADNNFPPQQMLSIFLQAVYHAKKLLFRNAIASFGICKGATHIADHTKLCVLLLLEDGARAVSEASVSRTYCPSSRGGTRMGADMSHSFTAWKAVSHS